MDFMRALRKSGAVAVFSGGRAKTFHGKIVVLINRQCASTAEAFAGVLKELQVATLIGPRRTAGAMLSSKDVDLSGGWKLTLPEADFRTPKGMRLEGIGVEPNIVSRPAGLVGDAAIKPRTEFLQPGRS